ncbi:guanine nucleotide-binding protein subunit gamma 3-like [Hevea brasiliensis]|uniref:guanine nucleotide-binding protein subunit gamma 3-like n=1 Tax=Hevea brasiliensis TaxID=3981 RepID=UPI0025FD2F4A|nr:guanine nucleotide-binding protein subunit gamma 3-like [Hevea brasiliensis]
MMAGCFNSWSSSSSCGSSSLAAPPAVGCPKSPPGGLDLFGKRRQLVRVQILEREIDLLQSSMYLLLKWMSTSFRNANLLCLHPPSNSHKNSSSCMEKMTRQSSCMEKMTRQSCCKFTRLSCPHLSCWRFSSSLCNCTKANLCCSCSKTFNNSCCL